MEMANYCWLHSGREWLKLHRFSVRMESAAVTGLSLLFFADSWRQAVEHHVLKIKFF